MADKNVQNVTNAADQAAATLMGSDSVSEQPVVTLATPADPAGTTRDDEGVLRCQRCGHKINVGVDNGLYEDGSVGHTCDNHLTVGYRNKTTTEKAAQEGSILVSALYIQARRLGKEALGTGKEEVFAHRLHRLQGGDGGIMSAVPGFEYYYVGGNTVTGKGGRKWCAPWTDEALLAILGNEEKVQELLATVAAVAE